MKTSMTSSHSLAVLGGFRDELIKIADAREEERQKMKRWLTTGAIVALGAGAGTGAAMVGEHVLSKALGPSWQSLPPQTRMKILQAGGAAVGTGLGIATHALAKQRMKYMDDHE